MRYCASIALLALFVFGVAETAGAQPALVQIGEFVAPEANQGVGVDAQHFYAVDNETIGKYDKATGKLVKSGRVPRRGRSAISTARC